MKQRTIVFIVLSSMILLGASILQSLLNPPPELADPVAAEQQPGQLQDPVPPPSEAAAADSEDLEAQPGDRASEPAEAAPQSEEQTTADPPAELPDSQRLSADEPAEISQLVTLGSLDPSGKDRFLVTLNSKGGAIRRVELNFRTKSGRLKYRDLDCWYGYLGELDCYDSADGCQIRVVGPGTPAASATALDNGVENGLRAGDILVSMDGIPITSSQDFQAMLEETRPKQTVQLTVRRTTGPELRDLDFNVVLQQKPLEILRPEPDLLDTGHVYPESLLLTLKKPGTVGRNWPELDAKMRTANWDLRTLVADGVPQVEFSYHLTAEAVEPLGYQGPITVYKRYWLPPLATDQIHELNSRTWNLGFEIEIKNGSAEQQELSFQLGGPCGAPTEGWWYQNKIHGRSTAVGYVAGARDVVGSSDKAPFVFYGGPEIVTNTEKSQPKFNYLFDPFKEDPGYRTVRYAGVDTQYFHISLLPVNPEGEQFVCYSGTAWTSELVPFVPQKKRLQKLVDCTFQLFKTFELRPDSSYRQRFEIFCGPKEPNLLPLYGLQDNRSFGWFAWFSKPLCWLLKQFYWLTLQISFGIPIILLTVLVRSLMIPISRKAALNAQMMQHLQPEIKAIADRYKDDMEKRAQAQRELFKKYNYNPFGGCFMMFLQLPIFIGLYRGLSVDVALRDQPLIPGLRWCYNLAAPDQLLYWKSWMPAFLADETGWLGPYFNVLPIITMVLFLMQQKLFMPPPTDDQQRMVQRMMSIMMIFMGVLFFKVPSGLCLYFITSSIWGMVERKMLPKPTLDTKRFDKHKEPSASSKLQKDQSPEAAPVLSNRAEIESRKRRDRERQRKLKQRGT